MRRRSAVQTLCLVAGSTLLGKNMAHAAPAPVRRSNGQPPAKAGETMSILVDTTRCVGCRLCEIHCLVKHSRSKKIVKAFRDLLRFRLRLSQELREERR